MKFEKRFEIALYCSHPAFRTLSGRHSASRSFSNYFRCAGFPVENNAFLLLTLYGRLIIGTLQNNIFNRLPKNGLKNLLCKPEAGYLQKYRVGNMLPTTRSKGRCHFHLDLRPSSLRNLGAQNRYYAPLQQRTYFSR